MLTWRGKFMKGLDPGRPPENVGLSLLALSAERMSIFGFQKDQRCSDAKATSAFSF